MSGPIEKPLARAASHLAAAQYAEAAGAYRAVLCIDPNEHRAHLGLADCAVGRGQVEEAIEELVAAAQDFAERGALPPAFALMTKALAIDPARLELHIDVAELEAAAGRADMATSRLQNLAHAYRSAGRMDEAEAVLEAAAAFTAMDEAEAELPEPGTTTLVTPTILKMMEAAAAPVVELEVEPELDLVDEAVPVEIVETHTMPQHVAFAAKDPKARTGDTFVGQPPRPKVEEAVARSAARRKEVAPALRWRASTIQMQALTSEIPGVPKKMAPMRTAPIVHAPKKAAAKKVEAKKPEPVVAKPVVAKAKKVEPIAKPVIAKVKVETKKPELKRVETKKPEPVVAKAPARKALAIKPLPGRAKLPAPAPKPVAAKAPAAKPPVAKPPAVKPVAAKPAPKKPTPPKPAPRKDGDSLAARLRRQSAGPRDAPPPAAKKPAAKKPEAFDEDATSLWCPEQLLLTNNRAAQ